MGMTESWDTTWEGVFAEDRREEVARARRAGRGGFGEFISAFVGEEVNMARGPVKLQVEYPT